MEPEIKAYTTPVSCDLTPDITHRTSVIAADEIARAGPPHDVCGSETRRSKGLARLLVGDAPRSEAHLFVDTETLQAFAVLAQPPAGGPQTARAQHQMKSLVGMPLHTS